MKQKGLWAFEDIDAQILRLWCEEYKTYLEIEELLGVGQKRIETVLDVNKLLRGNPRTRWLNDNRKEIIELYKLGWTLQEVRKKYSISFEKLCELLAIEGIEKREKGPLTKNHRRTISEAKHLQNALKTNLKPSADLYYLLGVCKGDGSVYGTKQGKHYSYAIALHVKDKAFALSFKKSFNKIGLTPTFCMKQGSTTKKQYYYVLAKSRAFYSWYQNIDWGDINKLDNKYIPNFIRGLYESEGGYYNYTPNKGGASLIALTSTESKLVEVYVNLLRKVGFTTSVHRHSNQRGYSAGKLKGDIFFVRVLGGKKAHNEFFSLINPCIRNPLK